MSEISFGKPRMILTRENFLQWHAHWMVCLTSYDTAGEEIVDHKPIVSDIMWEIQEFNGEEIWVQVPMSECQKKQVPSRLSAWKSDFERYKRTKGA